MRNRNGLLGGMMVAVALLSLQAQGASAQALNMTGTWAFQVESQTGVSTPTLTLTQDGMALTGHYSSEQLGEADVTGTVDGRTVTVNFEADMQGMMLMMSYAGDVNAEGVWTGSLSADVQGQIAPIGTFTASKS